MQRERGRRRTSTNGLAEEEREGDEEDEGEGDPTPLPMTPSQPGMTAAFPTGTRDWTAGVEVETNAASNTEVTTPGGYPLHLHKKGFLPVGDGANTSPP